MVQDTILTPRFVRLLENPTSPSLAVPSRWEAPVTAISELEGRLSVADFCVSELEGQNVVLKDQLDSARRGSRHMEDMKRRLGDARIWAEQLAVVLCGELSWAKPEGPPTLRDILGRVGETARAEKVAAHEAGTPGEALEAGELTKLLGKLLTAVGSMARLPARGAVLGDERAAMQAKQLATALERAKASEARHQAREAQLMLVRSQLTDVEAERERFAQLVQQASTPPLVDEDRSARSIGRRVEAAQHSSSEEEVRLESLLARCTEAAMHWAAAEQAGKQRRTVSRRAAEELKNAASLAAAEAAVLKRRRGEVVELVGTQREMLRWHEHERAARLKLGDLIQREQSMRASALRTCVSEQVAEPCLI